MELKDYQQSVINDLETFLGYIERSEYIGRAFQNYWQDKGVRMEAYKYNVQGVPHVCIKVPTAGGKTFIAVNALRPIFESFTKVNPAHPKVVVWLVPSITILDQTIKALGSADHPYNLKLKTHYNGRIEIFDKKDILQGVGFDSDSIREQLNIIVLSFDSLRARKKEDRKLFQENGNLADFTVENEDVLEGADESSVMSVIRSLKPVCVLDESHNAESPLSVEMLQNLNPSFILDLTATPKNNSNIISVIDASQLKKNHMVKLPVVVQNQRDKAEVIANALNFQRQLEEMAKAEEVEGGIYIRPIVLFQAQPVNAEDATTFEDIKKKLVKLGIPEEQIAIKTAEINEIKNVDLMSRDCPVRFIITINALKEGWDCPFAYILASLANKVSAVDVEQILGRVLRQPSVKQHKQPLLNLSYVFTASTKFLQTLENIVKGLNRAGFSNRDFRVIEEKTEEEVSKPKVEPTFLPFFDETKIPDEPLIEIEEDIDVSKVNIDEANQNIEELKAKALEINFEFEKKIVESGSQLPIELAERTNNQPMKSVFAEDAKKLKLPQFFIKVVGSGGFFNEGENEVLLNNDELLSDFRLSQENANIDFDSVDSETYYIDLERVGENDFTPTFRRMNRQQVTSLNEKILSLPEESKLEAINARFCKLIGNMYPIPDLEVKRYVSRILEQMPTEQLKDCVERDFTYSLKIKRKIEDLATLHKERVFLDYLDTDKVIVKPNYELPESITPSSNANAILKSLYVNESGMNTFESTIINELANQSNIVFWHKIIEKKGFRINGFLNHYPDFLLLTKSGKIIIVESKGDHLDNSDSMKKLRLGQLWASKAGNNYRYFMVFENKPIENAHKLDEAVKLISQI